MKRYSYAINPQPLEEAIQGIGQPLQQAIMESSSKEPVLPPEASTERQGEGGWSLAIPTAYNSHEDKYGSTTARKNPLTGEFKAVEDQTIAVDSNLIPYGSTVEVQMPDGSVKRYLAHDTGSDVIKRTAARKRGIVGADGQPLPTIDFFTNRTDLDKVWGNEPIRYRIVPPTVLDSNP